MKLFSSALFVKQSVIYRFSPVLVEKMAQPDFISGDWLLKTDD
jgi:hypothetical protein